MSTAEPDVYAVIRSGGKQYRVSPGQQIKLERLDGDAGDAVSFEDVLMVSGGGKVSVGTPTLDSASVSGEIVEQGRGRKIRVFKYKNKTRYRRLRGHRQLETSVLVNEVALGRKKWNAEGEVKPSRAKSSKKASGKAASSKAKSDDKPDVEETTDAANETAETED